MGARLVEDVLDVRSDGAGGQTHALGDRLDPVALYQPDGHRRLGRRQPVQAAQHLDVRLRVLLGIQDEHQGPGFGQWSRHVLERQDVNHIGPQAGWPRAQQRGGAAHDRPGLSECGVDAEPQSGVSGRMREFERSVTNGQAVVAADDVLCCRVQVAHRQQAVHHGHPDAGDVVHRRRDVADLVGGLTEVVLDAHRALEMRNQRLGQSNAFGGVERFGPFLGGHQPGRGFGPVRQPDEQPVFQSVRAHPVHVELGVRLQRGELLAAAYQPDGPVLDGLEDVVDVAVVVRILGQGVGRDGDALGRPAHIVRQHQSGPAGRTEHGLELGHGRGPLLGLDRGIVDR